MDPEVSHAMGELQATESRIVSSVETRIAHEVRGAEERMEARLATEIQASEARLGDRITTEIQASEARLGDRITTEIQASEGRMRELIIAGDQETRRHMTVLVEALRSDFRVATEPLVDLGRRVQVLEVGSSATTERLDVLELRVTALEGRGRRRPPRRR